MKRSYSEFLGQQRSPLMNRETTSLPDQLDGFYGRDGDMEAIRSLLLSDDANPSNLGVIPIVGMGGIGKTTLAQHLYNDEEVAKHFKIRGWICVSVEFTVLRLTKLILEEVTGRAPDSNNLNQLQRNLMAALYGKKFLLVLDDVWSDNYFEWTKLLTPLRYGEAGSKIIITTRQQNVASMGQTVPTHFLKVLEDEDCWKLFARHAFLDVNPTANPPELQEIGIEIVRKCRGLPLAAKALGGVLRRQTKAEKWKEVSKSEIWDVQNTNVLPALAMSYIHLPSHLKRCFAYCAVFPQDHRFQKEELVALWKSEGFVVQQKGDYFDDLVSRSFFEQHYGCFVMHDLVHDLARFVSGQFCSRLEGETSWKIGERTRHLSYETIERDVLEKFQGTHETPFLRSFVRPINRRFRCGCFRNLGKRSTCVIDKEVIDGLLPSWKLLRVLCLYCPSISELSNSIGNLKHLRHLNLTGTSIRLLPEAVTALFNLEILILRECRELVELPADLARLINLWQLDLRGTPGLKRMPPEMGKLKKLSQLSDFVVGENGGSNIEELGDLRCLRGQISIRGLQNVRDAGDASEALLKDKENLKALILSWDGRADDSWQVKQVLERLQPHTLIENIEIKGYGGKTFPNWVGDVSFSKLKNLRLSGYMNCNCLPPLGQLASLEEFSICDDGGVHLDEHDELLEAIGAEFYGTCKPGEKPFSSLKRLKFECMGNWREWSCFSGAFPVLEELELSECPELMSVPSHLPSLKRLRIISCGELDFEDLLIFACATLESIEIWNSEKVKYVPLETFPNLKELKVIYCSNLESLGTTAAAAATTTTTTNDPIFSPSLTSLSIRGSSKFSSFSRGLHAPNLERMDIEYCGNLKSLPCLEPSLLPSLVRLGISGCPEIESFPEGGLPSQLQALEITSCEKLVGGRMQWGLQSLSCLSRLSIGGGGSCEEDVESSFPEETLLPSSLHSLEIIGFAKMKSLNYNGLQHLSSLQHLVIKRCKNLESLPEEGLPSCLSSLQIYGCPLLEKRCEREIGEDWPKIKHIPRLYIKGH